MKGLTLMRKTRPSIIAQRSVSFLTGDPRPVVRNYSRIDPKTVARPVGIGSTFTRDAALRASQARVLTTVSVIDGLVVDDHGIRPASMAWLRDVRNGDF
jgi:hypothetical protein